MGAEVLADLHAHYPMHVVEDLSPRTTVELMRRARGRPRLPDRARALLLKVLSALLSNSSWWSGYRVTVEQMRAGGVGLAFSVLYGPFEEMDLRERYQAPPKPSYFDRVIRDLEAVEDEVGTHDAADVRVAHNRAELDASLTAGATALVHCIEGGFHLGAETEEIRQNVATLARRGVAYVTVAHLFYRQVATNAPALPFLPDPLYNRLFPQPADVGLTERGEAAVEAMFRNRVLVDLSHMRPDAIDQVFDLLDRLDPDREMPVISTHAGYRFGHQAYMHDASAVLRIKERDGVIGLIMAQHQLNDGIRRRTKTFSQALDVICRHIDKIGEITGSHRHVALGTDFDGFIKPTMSGLENMADLSKLEDALRARYGADAKLITADNALRVLHRLWPEPPASPSPPA